MRILSWNIRAGGGARVTAIADQISRWHPDLVVLSEFRGTPPSQAIAADLRVAGLAFQRQSPDPGEPARNALLVASRWPLRRLHCRQAPADLQRWLCVGVAAPQPLSVLAVHVPNRSSGRKYPFLEALARVAGNWRGRPGVLVGDTNSGRIALDEESPAFSPTEDRWLAGMEDLDWRDAFRVLHGARREFTWYSPNAGNGFRLDQAFLQPPLRRRLRAVSHRWGGAGGGRRDALSDHRALLLDLQDP